MTATVAGRKGAGHTRTLGPRQLNRQESQIGALLYPERNLGRPQSRQDCAQVCRPCPHVSCKYHLFLEVTPAGNLKLNHPELEPLQLLQSCALDVAEQGGATLDELSVLLNLSRERVRQIERDALAKLRRSGIDLEEVLR